MIVSHRYRFIFLKTAKTAGTSIELALSRFLGPDDIITPVSAEDESLRKQLGGIGPQNYQQPHNASKHWLNRLRQTFSKQAFYNHMPAAEVRALVGEHIWGTYFRFCVERNPFERAVSLYYWCCRKGPRPPISQFLQSPRIQLLTQRGIQIYMSGSGQMLVDRILRYENLAAELETVRMRLGLPEPLLLPNAKGGLRPAQQHYSELLSSDDRRIIERQFCRELELFQYRWETVTDLRHPRHKSPDSISESNAFHALPQSR